MPGVGAWIAECGLAEIGVPMRPASITRRAVCNPPQEGVGRIAQVDLCSAAAAMIVWPSSIDNANGFSP